MRGAVLLLAVVLWLPAVGSAAAALSARRHVAVEARDPLVVQQLCAWSEEAWTTLETLFGVSLPADPGQPLLLRQSAGVERVRIHYRGRNGSGQEVILIPEDLGRSYREVADAVAEVLLERLVRGMRQGEGPGVAPLPRWLVAGVGAAILPSELPQLRRTAVQAWEQGDWDFPETWARSAGSGTREELRAACAMMLQWLEDRMVGDASAWRQLIRQALEEGRGGATPWLRGIAGMDSLRELHIGWDLWMSSCRDRLVREDSMLDRAILRLEAELWICPGLYGFEGGGVPRYAWYELPALAQWVDAAWLPDLLRSWMLRVQLLKQGQREEFLAVTERFLSAGRGLIIASEAQGRRRARLLREFRREWESARLALQTLENQLAVERASGRNAPERP